MGYRFAGTFIAQKNEDSKELRLKTVKTVDEMSRGVVDFGSCFKLTKTVTFLVCGRC